MSSRLHVDDRVLGEFGEDSINQVRAELEQRRPPATFRSGVFLAVDCLGFLLSVDYYDPDSDAEFAHLLRNRLTRSRLRDHRRNDVDYDVFAILFWPPMSSSSEASRRVS